MVDSFFGFLDKHLKPIAIAAGAFIVYRTIQSTVPSDDEKKQLAEDNARLDVNTRLTPPPVPVKDAKGEIDKAAEVRYNAALKGHRSAVFAKKLWDAIDGPGTDEKTIMAIAYDMAVCRVSLAQVRADYKALQAPWGLAKAQDLLDDLKGDLSSAEYLEFMRRVGLSVDKAYAATHPKATTKKK